MDGLTLQSRSTQAQPARRVRRRVVGGVVAAACLGVLMVAASLHASDAGYGTHTQLGLPACSVQVFTDMPCPTCGVTTAFTHAAHGRLLTAAATQPLGATLALGLAMAAIIGAYVAATGANVVRWLAPLRSSMTVWIVLGIVAASWVYKAAVMKGWLG